ncbi:MAG: serine hydrolase [Solobacterium sp.]|nr:serine hydrolase [Solobacterium sp.]
MKMKMFPKIIMTAAVLSAAVFAGCEGEKQKVSVTKSEKPADGIPQVHFPDRKGYADETLAMNSQYSFPGFKGQGVMYITVDGQVEGFDLFINNTRIDTSLMRSGTFKADFSQIAVNGTNTVQVTNIVPEDLEDAVTLSIPFPEVIGGTSGELIPRSCFDMIERIIEADIRNGFSSAQLAVIKDGKLVYENAWGTVRAYSPDGIPLKDSPAVTNDTMYDLASNTKMYAAAYAVQYLADRGMLSLDEKVMDIIGLEFINETLEIPYAAYGSDYPGPDTIREWKSRITVKNLLMHQAGFPDSGHYHNRMFDAVNQHLSDTLENPLYVEDADQEKTLREGICRTPLVYEPLTRTLYSDIDYMLLGLIIEKKTGQDLQTFLSETFWKPMGLEHITYCPLQHGFAKDDCAATELCGNTRDGLVTFPGVRTETLQGEVHDEECYYTMESVSGHAGLFASASDLAKLASVMLTGGYGNTRFFSKDIRDLFISPQSGGAFNYGIGWWRQGDDRRSRYFGSQAPDSTVGHQGWTGTLTMIDFENNMIVVYLTNSINTPVYDPSSIERANDFSGRWYTSSTLGFIPSILYTGISGSTDPKEALDSLMKDMVTEKKKLVRQYAGQAGGELPGDHPANRALKALQEAAGLTNEEDK